MMNYTGDVIHVIIIILTTTLLFLSRLFLYVTQLVAVLECAGVSIQ